MHVQFRAGTSLEDAHRTAHELQDLIEARLGDADVLIHLEPEDRVRPGEEIAPCGGRRARATPRRGSAPLGRSVPERSSRRLMAADRATARVTAAYPR